MTTPNDGNFSSAELTNLDARVSELSELQLQKNAMYAREAQLIHEVTQLAVAVQERTRASRQAAELPYRTVAAELGAAFRISDRSAQRMMSEADTLVTRFSGTFKSLAAGRISQAHVRVLIDAGAHITDAQARADFETAALPVAERESASRLRPFARLLAERIHPRSLTERHEAAAEDRAVRVVDLPDGMAELIATLPTAIAYAAFDRLSAMARAVTRAIVAEAKEALGGKEALRAEEAKEVLGRKEALGAEEALGAKGSPALDVSAAVVPDTRSTDQLRADILADLLLAGAPEAHGAAGFGAIRAHVQVVVPVLALLGQSEEPATLVGVGAIDADTARRLAGSAKGWDRVLTTRSPARCSPPTATDRENSSNARYKYAINTADSLAAESRCGDAISTTPPTSHSAGKRPTAILRTSASDITRSSTSLRGRWCSNRAVFSNGRAQRGASIQISRQVSSSSNPYRRGGFGSIRLRSSGGVTRPRAGVESRGAARPKSATQWRRAGAPVRRRRPAKRWRGRGWEPASRAHAQVPGRRYRSRIRRGAWP